MKGRGRGALFELFSKKNSEASSSDQHAPTSQDSEHNSSGKQTQLSQDSACESQLKHSGSESDRLGQKLSDLDISGDRSKSSIKDTTPTDSGINKPRSGRGRAALFDSVLSSLGATKLETTIGSNLSSAALHASAAPSSASVAASNASVSETSNKKTFYFYLPDEKSGKRGKYVELACNYIPLECKKDMGVYMYEVKFYPPVDSQQLRARYLHEHSKELGGVKSFDGITLYLPIKLAEDLTTFVSKSLADGSDIEVRIMYKKKQPMKDCIHLYNVLFNRVMKVLNYSKFNRKHFDPTSPKFIPSAKLEIWPGYVTSVDEFEGGLMLCCDISHRLLDKQTVLEQMNSLIKADAKNFKNNAKKMLLGSVVITKYNNRTYRIDDVYFNQSPKSTFMIKDQEVSFAEYYRKNYNIQIKDMNQPLLGSMSTRKTADGSKSQEMVFTLIPELCVFSGLREGTDQKLLREIASFTRVSPPQRIQALQTFFNNVTNTPAAVDILKGWGLTLKSPYEITKGRVLDEETVLFASKKFSAGTNGDFSKYAVSNALLEVVNLENWVILHCRNDQGVVKSFLQHLTKNTPALGIGVANPKIVELQNDRVDTFVNNLRSNIDKKTQMVVCICPSSRDDRYNAIKKLCCSEIPVPSQVINARTLSNETKNRSIVQKIALQMNCKLGGSLWSVNIPFDNVMICGIDSYHDPGRQSSSVAGFVASMNKTYSKWYSKTIFQTRGEEIVTGLCNAFICALHEYHRLNGVMPKSVIIYRDGVGDGQLSTSVNFEVPQFFNASKKEFHDFELKLTFVVVQKRINTRFFLTERNAFNNPAPGTILDHTITRKSMYDFFLISQAVRQGTVTPSHYVVLRDDSAYKPDILQRLTYKLCFLYYNWPGTIRTPACCQYAHKLSALVGKNIRRPPSDELSHQLFYL